MTTAAAHHEAAEARVAQLEEALRRIAYGAFAYGEAGAVSDLRGIAKGALAFPPLPRRSEDHR